MQTDFQMIDDLFLKLYSESWQGFSAQKNDHNQLLQVDYKHQNWSKEVFHMTVMTVLSTVSKCSTRKKTKRLIFSIIVEKLVIINSEYTQLKETFHLDVKKCNVL